MIRDFLGYKPKWKDESDVEVTIKSNYWLAALVATVVHCLLEKKKRGRHRQEEYSDTYEGMADTVTKQLISSVREVVKHWF